jgi:nitrite reductase/ring-hydroxylating ferredoxin subunit
MSTQLTQQEKIQRGAEDSGAYFRYMMEYIGFTPEDAAAIRQSSLVIEKHIPSIVAAFYAQLLRYPPTRKFFLKKDGSIDQDYLQKRMHHLTNFWRRTASGEYDDEYARYVDYVGRAHTSHGADPSIYIAERYVIGQVGLMQYAITKAITQELAEYDPDLEQRAVRAWNMLMMAILEMLSRAYGHERELEQSSGRFTVDVESVQKLAVDIYEKGLGLVRSRPTREVLVAKASEIPNGERKIVQVGDLSIGIFHHKDQWAALLNHCLHRGGPVATGCLEDDTLICPWHGFQYNVLNGQLLVDPALKLQTFPVVHKGDDIYLVVPEGEEEVTVVPTLSMEEEAAAAAAAAITAAETLPPIETPAVPDLQENEFLLSELEPGEIRLVQVDGEDVAVYNVDGSLYATQNACTHVGGPLDEGELEGEIVTCPWHGSCFNVTSGAVTRGPAKLPLKQYRVQVEGNIVRVMS